MNKAKLTMGALVLPALWPDAAKTGLQTRPSSSSPLSR